MERYDIKVITQQLVFDLSSAAMSQFFIGRTTKAPCRHRQLGCEPASPPNNACTVGYQAKLKAIRVPPHITREGGREGGGRGGGRKREGGRGRRG